MRTAAAVNRSRHRDTAVPIRQAINGIHSTPARLDRVRWMWPVRAWQNGWRGQSRQAQVTRWFRRFTTYLLQLKEAEARPQLVSAVAVLPSAPSS